MSNATVFEFIPRDRLERAVTVLDIAVGRGLPVARGLHYALESLGLDPGEAPDHARRMVETAWKRRAMGVKRLA
jgi:hypothetical protein